MWYIKRLSKVGSGLIKYPSGEYARRLSAVFSSRPFVFCKGPMKNSERFIMETALTFNNVTLTPIILDGLWIRAAELAHAHGYAQENSVSRIYRSNADEFTP